MGDRTADPSTTRRSGRDEKGSGVTLRKFCDSDDRMRAATPQLLQIPRLHYAPVGMTRGVRLRFGSFATRMDGNSLLAAIGIAATVEHHGETRQRMDLGQ
jgi:hypothetical protein